jgi:hypothetical protein
LALYADKMAGKTRFGQVLETDPRLGLLGEVNRSAGFLVYLQERISETEGETGHVELSEMGRTGPAPTVLVKLWKEEREHFARICKLAIDAGIEREKLDLIVSYTERVLDLIENVLRALGLDPDSPEVDAIVTRQLALISAAGVVPAVAS